MNNAWPFIDHLGGMDAASWDRLARGRLYSSDRWLQVCAMDARNSAGAVSVENRDDCLAIPVVAVAEEPNPFYRWAQLLTERGLPAPSPQGILAGPHRAYQSHLLSSGPITDSAMSKLLERLTALPELAARARLFGAEPPNDPACMAMFLSSADVTRFLDTGISTMPLLLDVEAWIPVPPGGWPAWLESLPRQRRELVRRDVRRFERAGYDVRQTTLGECLQIAGRLLALTETKYGHDTTHEQQSAALARQATVMGSDARVLLCMRDERPVGYCLYYATDDVVYLRSAGFDYELTANAAEYFNLLYYFPLRIAAQAGARWVHAGITSLDAKALRGAELRPLWMLDLSPRSVLRGFNREIVECNVKSTDMLVSTSVAVAKALCDAENEETERWGWRPHA